MKAWIEKITLEGFKSYGKERVEIPLGPGFIGIVGPNGAGKSNIGDAISFALGIATAKTLRAKNLSYLIYAKDSERADYAFVEVHFKNYGLFPIQEEDIYISRKVYPDGRTVFRINGAVVRERDLSDFLARAGIYENAYNVVLQGDIVKFLKMTPIERRKLIEEIAGIEEYEEKKQKAFEDLAQVELRLRELRLLMEEIQAQMERLTEEVKRLHIYRRLVEEKRSLEIKLNLKTASELEKSVRKISEDISLKKSYLERLQESIKAGEEKVLSLEEELKKVNENLLPYREKAGRLSQQIENLTGLIEETLQKVEKLKQEIVSTQEQIASLEKQKEFLLKEEQELVGRIEDEEKELLRLEALADQLWKTIKEKEEGLKVSLEEMEKTEEKLKQLQKSIQDAKSELADVELKLRELELKKEKVKEDTEKLLEEEKRLKAQVEEALVKREEFKRTLQEEEKALKVTKEVQARLEEELRRLRQEREELLRQMATIQGMLQSMQAEELPFEDIDGVYGRVSELIRVKEADYVKAVEVAGGARLSYVVVKDEEVAKKCIQRLRELKWGRLNFIPLNRMREMSPLPLLPRYRGVIDFVVNLVEYDRSFEKAVRFVFGDTLLVDSFDTAKALGNAYRIVTLEGELFEKSGIISGGYMEERGQLGRELYLAQLEELKAKEEDLRKKELEKEKLLKSLREELIQKEGIIAVFRRRLEEAQETETSCNEKLNQIRQRLLNAEQYVHMLEEEAEKFREKAKALKDQISYLEEKLRNLSVKRHSFLLHYKEAGLDDLRLEYENYRRKVEAIRNSIHSLQLRLKEIQMEREGLDREIERRLSFVEDALAQIEALNQKKEETKREKLRLEEELKELNATAYELFRRRESLEKELRQMQAELGKLRLEEESTKEELHGFALEKTKLEEKYAETLAKLKELGYEGEVEEVKDSYAKLREELSRVLKELSSIGSVNFRAEEEYAEYEERYADYQERYTKLREEKESIKELIQEIESKKLRAFMETFRAIDKNLRRIFSQLSPGGRAYMVLEKEEDPFTGGINLVVKPRGKEVQYLEAISGGEKTLAALSLIFAIQDYRPSPFYYFDEVDAHLDEANARRVGELIKERSKQAQFIVVTLREVLASFADKIIGVSGRGGISRVFTLKNDFLVTDSAS